jgi:predicted DsbA family dithiol-disulfide isomerase
MPERSEQSVAVYSDYVCPFCYLGRASLREYQSTREQPLAIDWRPFDLRAQQRGPDGEIDESIDDGKDESYYEQARQNVQRLQRSYDVEMDLEVAKNVDSLPTQRASLFVQQTYPEQWLVFDEAILDALWQDGRDIGQPDVLGDLAEDVGLDGSEIHAALTDETVHDQLIEAFEAARAAGISGVPTFVFDGHVARGAVPPEQLQRLVEGV